MSLFNRRRSVQALNEDALATIKHELDSTLKIAASFDKLMQKSNTLAISLEGRIRGDLLAFVLYLSGVGKKHTDPAEIKVVNKIFDTDLSLVDFELFRKDVSDDLFQTAVPPSILIMSELGKMVQREQFRKSDGTVAREGQGEDLSDMLVADLINLYALIGSALLSADGRIRKSESADLIRYLDMMNRTVNGDDAPLPKGPAQQAMAAHVRLFGKKPKLR